MMNMKKLLVIILSFLSAYCYSAVRFNINAELEVFASRSTTPGKKMVRVVAEGASADKAIQQAMCDAIVALTFRGAYADGEMEAIPPILIDGVEQYDAHKKEFNQFFKKKNYLNYVSRVNSTYPSGSNNIKTSTGRRVQILLIVDWIGLANYYKSLGYKTATSNLTDF